MLHCQGSNQEKANLIFELLQEGGTDRHNHISASDKDIVPVFNKICTSVTSEVFNMANQEDQIELSQIVPEDEMSMATTEGVLETVRESQWIEEVFGANSHLNSEDFM